MAWWLTFKRPFLAHFNTTIYRLESENKILKENEENREALKQAFAEKQEAWAAKERDHENKIAELNEKIASVSDENIQIRKIVDDVKSELSSARKELEEIRNEHRLKLKDIEIENQNALSELKLRLAQENEERLKAAIEKERMVADKRIQEFVALIAKPEKNTGGKRS